MVCAFSRSLRMTCGVLYRKHVHVDLLVHVRTCRMHNHTLQATLHVNVVWLAITMIASLRKYKSKKSLSTLAQVQPQHVLQRPASVRRAGPLSSRSAAQRRASGSCDARARCIHPPAGRRLRCRRSERTPAGVRTSVHSEILMQTNCTTRLYKCAMH